MSQWVKSLDRGSEAEVSDSEGILETTIDRHVPKQGELRPLARALIDLAISMIEEEESDR